MKKQDQILVVDNDIKTLDLTQTCLWQNNFHVTISRNYITTIKLLKKYHFSLIVVGDLKPENSCLELTKHIVKEYRNSEIVIMTASSDEKTITTFGSLGITFFISKPFHEKQFVCTIYAALRHIRKVRSIVFDKASSMFKYKFVGVSKSVRRVTEDIITFANSDVPILISGETGTGKDIIANRIHMAGNRWGKPFVPVNCSTLGTLAESEFFGHTKGAFTSAGSTSLGYAGAADRGTLFLDEVCDLPTDTQTKLLRFLDSGEYYSVGSNSCSNSDTRIICATNCDLKERVKQGRFRQDLYYRIAGVTIYVEPLRSRPEDIPHLVGYFLEMYSNIQNRRRSISPSALDTLTRYLWPGNVRELKQTIYTLTLSCSEREIDYPDVIHHIGPVDISIPEKYHDMKEKAINDFDTTYFTKLQGITKGSLKQALEISGMHKKNFYEKLKHCNLSWKMIK